MMLDHVITDEFDARVEDERGVLENALEYGISGRSHSVKQYELATAEHFSARHAVSASSGFGALVIALSALGLTPGCKVFLTPTCPICTVYALTFMRLIPVFCDTQKDNFGTDLEHASAQYDGDVVAMIEIPMWGYPLDAQSARSFCQSKGISLIIDIALAHKAKFNGRLLAAYGDMATFSTHWSKNFVTGEGGCVLTDNAELAAKAREFSYPNDPKVVQPSMNYAMAGLQAALGLARLSRLDGDIARRQENAKRIASRLDNQNIELMPVVVGGETGGTKLLLREVSGDNKALLLHMDRCGVPSDILNYRCRPLYEFPVLEKFRSDCPNAESLLASMTTIPVHPDLSRGQIEHIVTSLNSYLPFGARDGRLT